MASAGKLVTGTLAICAALAGARPAAAQSIGFLRMPSTVAQFLGYGYGAGHHVPIVHTPAQHPPRTQRRAVAPRCYGPLGPAAYATVGCYDGSCYGAPYAAPLGAPMAQPAPPMAAPDPMAFRPGAPYGRR